ncbi:hypothetical protein HNP24_000552 [Chryseobacterium sediminis]|uniref:RHS repeat protein n=1 Tax=Chryseobacterium sediminis TaxID=1679494 RepID=A0ABR6PV69_9FLAO|nr:hypothetical protein [Chryseobacterium sediminis]MBB6329602.1 hypothetical protein [Chryseobacterium sediminis]
MNLHGFLTGVRLNPFTNTQVYNLYSGAAGINGLDWRLGSSANGYEGEPDSFSFSVLGLSGKFMIGNDGNVLVESNDPNIKVDISGLQSYGTLNDCKLTPSQIIMKDGKGNIYYFGGDFSKYEVSYTVPSYNGPDHDETSPFYTINSWSISKIDFANGKTVTFNYVQDNLNSSFCTMGIGGTLTANAKVLSLDTFFQDGFKSGYLKNCPGGFLGCEINSSQNQPIPAETYIMLKKSLLESINFNNTSIFINYKDTGYSIVHHELATRFFNEFVIDYISLKQSGNTIKNYQFNYVDYGGVNKRTFLSNILETKSNAKYSFEYYNTGNLPKYYTKGIDHWGFWNGKDSNTTLLAQDTYNAVTGDYTLNNTVRDPNTSLYNIGLLKKITYPTSGNTTFEYEPPYYGKRVERNSGSAFLPTLTNNTGYIGGARIKRQYDYSENGGLINEKEYQYSTTLAGTTSSGILMNWPRYLYYIERRSNDGTFYSNLFLKNSSNVQQNSLDSYNVGYSKVYEIDKNKGYIEHNFYSYEDIPDLLNPDVSNIRNYFDNPPVSSTYPSYPENLHKNLKNLYGIDKSIMRGKPKSDVIYPQNSVNPLKKIEYVYNDNIDYNPNTSKDNNNYISINHLSGDWVQGYKKYFNTSSIKKKIITDFLNNNPIINTTEYFYDSDSHLNLSRENNILSHNTIISKSLYYAQDFQADNYLLRTKNMIGIPLLTEMKENNKSISKTEIKYPKFAYEIVNNTVGLALPVSMQSVEINTVNTANPSGEIKSTEVTYDQYDSKGNLLQFTTKNGISTVIIWGYNQTLPIAKIEGAKLTDIQQSLIDPIVTASNTDASAVPNNDETSLLSVFNTFRNSLPNYQITTYTYDPLIGVRSITPPSGIRENYVYDSAGRLQKIVNVNGQTVKEMKYNYKN